MEVQLHQRRALHVARFDVVNTADVEKMVLVVVGQKAFHLRRIHATVWLTDIDDWQVQFRKDINFHAFRQPIGIRPFVMLKQGRRNGQEASEQDTDNDHHDRRGPTHGGKYEVHGKEGLNRQSLAERLNHSNSRIAKRHDRSRSFDQR